MAELGESMLLIQKFLITALFQKNDRIFEQLNITRLSYGKYQDFMGR